MLMLALAPVAQAAMPSCLGPERLAVLAAFTRPGSGGTYNYVARIANSSMRPIRFEVRFQMVNAQPNRGIRTTQMLNGRTYRDYVLANGLTMSDQRRITESVQLICR